MSSRLFDLIDCSVSARTSLVRRYYPALELAGLDDVPEIATLERVSYAEGATAFELASVQGVQVLVIDETSMMSTGTYKDLDACLICARGGTNGVRLD